MTAALSVMTAAPRLPPRQRRGALAWLRENLFRDWRNGLATVVMLIAIASLLPPLLRWGVTGAVFAPDVGACRAAQQTGACWGMIAEKYRLIFFGRYPYDEQWRPLLAMALVLTMLVASGVPRMWRATRVLAAGWLLALAAAWLLMHGGAAGLTTVETIMWGGLPLTVMLSLLGLAGAFPLAVLIALGRRSQLPAIRALCILYVELIRGIPLITVLFMASFLFPLFMPNGLTVDVLIRVQIGIVVFSAAYLAETIRAGLQALPKGQYEAAAALGLTYGQTTRRIVLPQALRHVVPPLVNTLIGTIQDTSLVTIVSLYDLTGALRLAIADPLWRGFYIEGYLFIGAIYFTICFGLSRYSRSLEAGMQTGAAR